MSEAVYNKILKTSVGRFLKHGDNLSWEHKVSNYGLAIWVQLFIHCLFLCVLIGQHFLHALFHGFEDIPPKFAVSLNVFFV